MPIRILVVDHDALQREVLCRFLSGHGFVVDTAVDACAAALAARRGCFDCVLVDYDLASSAGPRFAAGSGPRPRLIGLAAKPEESLTSGAELANRFDIVLRKPWDPAALLDAIIQGHRSPSGLLEEAALPKRPTPAEAPAARILVVDDDDIFRPLIASALQNTGHAVLTAPNGFRALLMIRQFVFDVVLLDFNLPDLDGVALAKLTRDLIQAPRRPWLIALTATPERVREREGLFVNHFDEILSKAAGLLPVLEAVQRCTAPRPGDGDSQKDPSSLKKRSRRLSRV